MGTLWWILWEWCQSDWNAEVVVAFGIGCGAVESGLYWRYWCSCSNDGWLVWYKINSWLFKWKIEHCSLTKKSHHSKAPQSTKSHHPTNPSTEQGVHQHTRDTAQRAGRQAVWYRRATQTHTDAYSTATTSPATNRTPRCTDPNVRPLLSLIRWSITVWLVGCVKMWLSEYWYFW